MADMIFVSLDDFYEKAAACRVLTRQEELACAARMSQGDEGARQQLIRSYLPMVANHVRRAKPHMQGLTLVLYYVQALEKAVDHFDFSQNSETFTHRLSRYLKQASVDYIVR